MLRRHCDILIISVKNGFDLEILLIWEGTENNFVGWDRDLLGMRIALRWNCGLWQLSGKNER